MTNFKKLMLASGVATALAGVSLPSHAIIEAAPGEALLVPFVLYTNDGAGPLNPNTTAINTLITVTTPSSVGFDTVPNFFTAPNSSPTNPPPVSELPDPDLGAPGAYTAGIHLYFFDNRSNELYNTKIPVSPDDLTLINWGDIVEKNAPALRGVKGYIVITTEKGTGQWRTAAKFSMFGDAFMIWPTSIGFIDTKIPVLPMSDGADTVGVTQPTTVNNVIHAANGSVIAASPLSSGMRTSRDNGIPGDYTLFDLTMSNRFAPTLHVIWVDENIGQSNIGFVFNDVEQACSAPLPIANELNVYWTSIPELFPGVPGGIVPALPWVDAAFELCYPEGKFLVGLDLINSDIFYPGFVRFQINEYALNALPTFAPTSAAVAFSIQLQIDVLDAERRNLIDPNVLPTLLPIETALGHERGQFESF
jgi:hypothetical protein